MFIVTRWQTDFSSVGAECLKGITFRSYGATRISYLEQELTALSLRTTFCVIQFWHTPDINALSLNEARLT